MRSSKLRNAILVISTILVFVLLGGFVASIVTETPPNEWFKKDDVIIDEPVVEEVLPLIASNEEEMNALLTEENVGRTVTYTGETIKNVDLPVAVGDTITHLCMDTSVDIKDWVLGLDWENDSFRVVQGDGRKVGIAVENVCRQVAVHGCRFQRGMERDSVHLSICH